MHVASPDGGGGRAGEAGGSSLLVAAADAAFQPHRVQHGQRHRETQSQNSTEIPHGLLLIGMAGVDIAFLHGPAQHAIDPNGVGDDDRKNKNGDAQHRNAILVLHSAFEFNGRRR